MKLTSYGEGGRKAEAWSQEGKGQEVEDDSYIVIRCMPDTDSKDRIVLDGYVG